MPNFWDDFVRKIKLLVGASTPAQYNAQTPAPTSMRPQPSNLLTAARSPATYQLDLLDLARAQVPQPQPVRQALRPDLVASPVERFDDGSIVMDADRDRALAAQAAPQGALAARPTPGASEEPSNLLPGILASLGALGNVVGALSNKGAAGQGAINLASSLMERQERRTQEAARKVEAEREYKLQERSVALQEKRYSEQKTQKQRELRERRGALQNLALAEKDPENRKLAQGFIKAGQFDLASKLLAAPAEQKKWLGQQALIQQFRTEQAAAKQALKPDRKIQILEAFSKIDDATNSKQLQSALEQQGIKSSEAKDLARSQIAGYEQLRDKMSRFWHGDKFVIRRVPELGNKFHLINIKSGMAEPLE